MPYGYGSNSFYGRNQNGQIGGLSGIAFGLAAGATTGLINAGIGLFNNMFGETNEATNNDQSQEVTDSSGVGSPNNPDGSDKNAASAKDAYDPPTSESDSLSKTSTPAIPFNPETGRDGDTSGDAGWNKTTLFNPETGRDGDTSGDAGWNSSVSTDVAAADTDPSAFSQLDYVDPVSSAPSVDSFDA
jgi:hypothetical protein